MPRHRRHCHCRRRRRRRRHHRCRHHRCRRSVDAAVELIYNPLINTLVLFAHATLTIRVGSLYLRERVITVRTDVRTLPDRANAQSSSPVDFYGSGNLSERKKYFLAKMPLFKGDGTMHSHRYQRICNAFAKFAFSPK